MNDKMFELTNAQVELVVGGIGVGGDGRIPVSPSPIGGIGDGSPYIGIGGWGRDWWSSPILKPEPGKP